MPSGTTSRLREIIERRIRECTERLASREESLLAVVIDDRIRCETTRDVLQEILDEADGKPKKQAKEENVRIYRCPYCDYETRSVGAHLGRFDCQGCGRLIEVDESTYQIAK
jgi:hypothetical protein